MREYYKEILMLLQMQKYETSNTSVVPFSVIVGPSLIFI